MDCSAAIGQDLTKVAKKVGQLGDHSILARYEMSVNDFLAKADHLLEIRGLKYGEPTGNHMRIAQLWGAYLGYPVEPHEVAVCMALVKISRIHEQADHKDSYEDAIAYMAIAGHIATADWDDLDTI